MRFLNWLLGGEPKPNLYEPYTPPPARGAARYSSDTTMIHKMMGDHGGWLYYWSCDCGQSGEPSSQQWSAINGANDHLNWHDRTGT